MSDKEQSDKVSELEEKYESLELRDRLNALRNDVRDLKGTYKEDKGNAPRQTKYLLDQYKKVIVLIAAIAIPAFFIIDPQITIPDWIYPIVIGLLVGGIVSIPAAKYVVELFIKDRRKPIAVIDPDNLNDLELYYVPQERLNDIEFIKGEPEQIQTQKGPGFSVEKFVTEQINGKEKMFAKGSWEGEKSGLELKRDYKNIEGMRETLKPLARKGFGYEVMWPHIIQEMQNDIANMFVEQFEGLAVYKGKELRERLEDIENKFAPDNIMEEVDENDISEGKDEVLREMLD